jgi:hypothetical protein
MYSQQITFQISNAQYILLKRNIIQRKALITKVYGSNIIEIFIHNGDLVIE